MRSKRWTAALYAAVTVAAVVWLIPVVTAPMISLTPAGDQAGMVEPRAVHAHAAAVHRGAG